MASRKRNFKVSVYQHGHSVGRHCVKARSKDAAVREAFGPDVKLDRERPGVLRVTDERGRFTYVEVFVARGCD